VHPPCAARDECTPLAAGALCEAATTACAAAEGEAFCDLPCLVTADCAALGGAFRCQGGHCRLPDGGNAGGAGGVPGRGGAGGIDASGAAGASGGPAGDGCLTTTLALGDNDRTVVVDGTPRRYVVRLPAAYRGATPVPLVLDFHTLGGSPAGEAAHSGYLEVSEREGFLVAWPEGLEGAGTSALAAPPPGRSMTSASRAPWSGSSRRRPAWIRRGIYAVGVANGGGMAYELACSAADVFAGIAPSAFDLLVDDEQPCRPTRPVTVIAFRGTADPSCPTRAARSSRRTASRARSPSSVRSGPSSAGPSSIGVRAPRARRTERLLHLRELRRRRRGDAVHRGRAAHDLGQRRVRWATLSRHARP
jgi:polyhydroxybutyrate depolymerase